MKFSTPFAIASLAVIALARPVYFDLLSDTLALFTPEEAVDAPYTTINEFVNQGCRPVILIFARGTSQDGNVGDEPGPQTIEGLKNALGDDQVAGQGFDYPAELLTNLIPGGCDPDDAENMAELIARAADSCPNSKIAVSGYSQGAALVHRSMELLSADTASRVSAAVTFGDTQSKQDNDQIPNVPKNNGLILCHDGDLVCEGTLIITMEHSGYQDLAPEAVDFLVSRLT